MPYQTTESNDEVIFKHSG